MTRWKQFQRNIVRLLRRKPEDEQSLLSHIHAPLRVGLIAALLLFGVFGAWAAFAPLKSAAIAMGQVIISGRTKTVQHLEGGIVDVIHVEEGQAVAEGDILLTLNETNARASLQLLNLEYYQLLAEESRLIAEQTDQDSVTYPLVLEENRDLEAVEKALANQNNIFASRRQTHLNEIDILLERVEQLYSEIDGLNAQKTSSEESLALMQEELDIHTKLHASGHSSKIEVLRLSQATSDKQGEIGQLVSEIARAGQAISEAQLSIYQLKTERQKEIAEALKEHQKALGDVAERLNAAEDVINRITIRAPVSGMVIGLKANTIGGVITPGEPIMNIVPEGSPMVVEARLAPLDIESVTIGQEARIRLSAYKSRTIPMLYGTVSYVSGDSFVDEQTGQPYFSVHVTIPKDELAQYNLVMAPGMPAEAYITTAGKTLLRYLLDPITDTTRKAFREL